MGLDKIAVIRPDPPKRRKVGSRPLEPDLEPRPEPPATKIPGPPWYGRAWFSALMGAVIAAGGALSNFAATRYIGIGITTACEGYIRWHEGGRAKSKKWYYQLIELLQRLVNVLEKYLSKRKEA